MLWSVIIENGTISATLPRENMTKLNFYTYADPKFKEKYYYGNSPLTDNSLNKQLKRHFKQLENDKN